MSWKQTAWCVASWLAFAGLAAGAGAQPRAAVPATPPPIRILLVGDSTATDTQGWGRGFRARLTDRATCVNRALNGRSSKSYRDEGAWQAAIADRADYVLIQFGHNDQPGKGPDRETDPGSTYPANLTRYVREARAAGMTAVLVTSLARRRFDAAGRIVSDLGPYVEAARGVAAAEEVPLVDLHASSIALLDRLGPERSGGFGVLDAKHVYDRTHLSELGSEAFGDLVADELARVVPAIAPYLRTRSIVWGECLTRDAGWYSGGEARRIADNVLLYQRSTGGWPKDLDMARVLDATERAAVGADRERTDSTIDNGATITQLRFLARMIAATGDERYRAAALAGLDYLLAAQYSNGGWPQFFPLRTDYSRHITYNDDAMVGVLRVLGDAAAGRAPFGFADPRRRSLAAAAVAKGLDVILATQVRAGGRLTVWAAQHDAVTLRPQSARTFEPAALCAGESVRIVKYLMEVPAPTPAVVQAVEDAVAWFRAARITGIRVESRLDPSAPRGWDRVVVPDPSAPPVWARFYEIGANRPLFSDRDSVLKERLDEIGGERRTGYAWYGTWPAPLLEVDYPAWKARLAR
jgi:PelA/Pel-15E family pectate lyase